MGVGHSGAANQIELAAVVGAFAAGLILDEEQFKHSSDRMKLDELIAPLERIFAPVFFVLMGMQVRAESTFWMRG